MAGIYQNFKNVNILQPKYFLGIYPIENIVTLHKDRYKMFFSMSDLLRRIWKSCSDR